MLWSNHPAKSSNIGCTENLLWIACHEQSSYFWRAYTVYLYSKISNSNSNIMKNSLLYVCKKSKYSRWPGKTATNSPRLLQLWCEPETGCMMHNQNKQNCGTRNCTSAYQVLALYEKNCCIYMMYLLDTIQISRIPYDSTQNDCRLVPCCTSLPPSSSKWEGEMDIFVGPRSALLGIVCPKKAAEKSHMFNLCVG